MAKCTILQWIDNGDSTCYSCINDLNYALRVQSLKNGRKSDEDDTRRGRIVKPNNHLTSGQDMCQNKSRHMLEHWCEQDYTWHWEGLILWGECVSVPIHSLLTMFPHFLQSHTLEIRACKKQENREFHSSWRELLAGCPTCPFPIESPDWQQFTAACFFTFLWNIGNN